MTSKHVSFIILFAIIAGCAGNKPPASNYQRDFFTPRDWQTPIVTKPLKTQPEEEPTQNKTNQDQVEEPIQDDAIQGPKEQMLGYASWYGPGFHGKKTANGEEYDQNKMTAAHRVLPMNTWVQATNLENNRSVVVRINDRGPFKKNRIIDMTRKAAESLDFLDRGTARVSLKIIQYPKDFDSSAGLTPYKQVVVQIAVFKNKERAVDFESLLSRKYPQISFKIDEYKPETYRVIAGPYEDVSQAKQIGETLKNDGVDNFVRSYRK
ncbi:septal ring lytic transglycosylase RlpA family protein [bacterium]|nr:septal ring lytic transglycosylase RlpA family protein [bacterium]